MKRIIIYSLAAMLMVVWFAGTAAMAEERYTTYEMADGQFVVFKMTPEEIRAEDAQKTRIDQLKKRAASTPRLWVEKIELPESGNFIEFPMSARQIQEARQKAAQVKKTSPRSADLAEKKTTIIEMADGNTVVFYTN